MNSAKKTIQKLRTVMLCACLFGSLALLPGCWDEVNLQDVSYISALGIDYKEGEVILYGQMINFSSVAKTESPSAGPAETWIGQGRGRSTLLAYHDMKRAGYTAINLEHLKTVLIHERALGKLDDVLDALNRQRASRYTSLIYGTTTDIMEVMTTENFFDQSPLYSVLYSPNPHDEQYTFIEPLQMQLLIQTMNEPAELSLLPVISSQSSYWHKDDKPIPTQLITGAFVFKDLAYKGYFPERSVLGLRWLNPEFHNVFVEETKKGITGTVSVKHSEHHIQAVDLSGKEPKFSIRLKMSGSLVEQAGVLNEQEIETSVEELIRNDIQSLFEIGVRRGIDFLELEHHLYRYHNRYWRDRLKNEEWLPNRRTLGDVQVEFILTDPGKFDLKKGA